MSIEGPTKESNESSEFFKGDIWVLPNDLSLEGQAVRVLAKKLQVAGWKDEEEIDDIGLAFGEALSNAMKYGNQLSENKKIFVDIKINGNEVSIKVRDEGEGFNPASSLSIETDKEGFERLHGRGVALMNAMVDSVVYNEKGNEVTMKKRSAHK